MLMMNAPGPGAPKPGAPAPGAPAPAAPAPAAPAPAPAPAPRPHRPREPPLRARSSRARCSASRPRRWVALRWAGSSAAWFRRSSCSRPGRPRRSARRLRSSSWCCSRPWRFGPPPCAPPPDHAVNPLGGTMVADPAGMGFNPYAHGPRPPTALLRPDRALRRQQVLRPALTALPRWPSARWLRRSASWWSAARRLRWSSARWSSARWFYAAVGGPPRAALRPVVAVASWWSSARWYGGPPAGGPPPGGYGGPPGGPPPGGFGPPPGGPGGWVRSAGAGARLWCAAADARLRSSRRPRPRWRRGRSVRAARSARRETP